MVKADRDRICALLELSVIPSHPEHSVCELLGNREVILYGAGDGLITFSASILDRYDINVKAVLDRRFKSGDLYVGIPAFSPLEFRPTVEQKENAVVVVTVGKQALHHEIQRCIKELGFKNVILCNQIYEYHLLNPPEELEHEGPGYYARRRDLILRAYDLLEDTRSREIFYQVLKTHLHRKPYPIPADPLEDQYFPKDIVMGKGYKRVINGGSYIGDTVRQLIRRHGKIDALVCFEPDLENFHDLSLYLIEEGGSIADEIIAFPCGMYSRTAPLRFRSGRRINSALCNNGDRIINVVSLDDALPRFGPTFINMDIEGAELEALRGAEIMICRDRPDLAVCVYHAPSHLWDILLYLHHLDLGYKFYLRNYTSFISETVLYASVP